MGIFRFNQNGVASDVQFGRLGGHVAWDNAQFKIADNLGNPVKLHLLGGDGNVGEAATIEDVNRKVQGLRTKEAASIIVTVNHDLSTALSGYDGVTTAIGMRVLFAGQTLLSENGVYTIDASFKPTLRTLDLANYMQIEGAYIYITQGTAGESTGWVLNVVDDTNTSATAGAFDVEVKQFHGQGAVKVGTGLVINESTINLALSEIALTAAPITYTDTLTLNQGTTHVKVGIEKLVDDLGISSWKIAHDGNNVSVSSTRTVGRDSIIFGTKAIGTTYSANASLVSIDSKDFVVDYNIGALIDGTVGSAIKLKAGAGKLERGGDVTLIAGASAGSAKTGGDIVLTPGAGTATDSDDGVVRIVSNNSLKLPVGTIASRPTLPEAGFIRVNTDTVTGVDTVEFYESQKLTWKAVGGGTKLADLDGDTYVSVASTAAGDEDEIKLVVGGGTTFNQTTVFEATATGINIKAPTPTDLTETTGGSVNISAASGTGGGEVHISTGLDSAGNPGTSGAGMMYINANGGLEVHTGNVISGDESGAIGMYTGNSDTSVGAIAIENGIGPEGQLDVGTRSTAYLNLGTNNNDSETKINGHKFIKIGLGGTGSKLVEVGDRAATALKLYGETVELFGKNSAGGMVSIAAETINVGNDISTTTINIGNSTNNDAASSTNVNVISESLVLEANASLLVKMDAADLNIRFETSATGVLEVTNPAYTAGVTAAQHIPNREFVSNALRDATLGGVGTRYIKLDRTVGAGAVGGVSFQLGENLPANARVTKVTLDVITPFVYAANALGASVNAASGVTALATNNDLDIYTAGMYIVELSGYNVSSGAVTLNFTNDILGSLTGLMYVRIEFVV